MRLDVRLPVGAMLALMGTLLAGYGLLGDRTVYARSLGVNINLIWGLALMATGACLLALSSRRAR